MTTSSQIQVVYLDERMERFVREGEREAITGLSKAAWWRREHQGRAPKRIRIDARTVAWKLSDLQRWVELTARGEEWKGEKP
jgi:prophage regulatory protein